MSTPFARAFASKYVSSTGTPQSTNTGGLANERLPKYGRSIGIHEPRVNVA